MNRYRVILDSIRWVCGTVTPFNLPTKTIADVFADSEEEALTEAQDGLGEAYGCFIEKCESHVFQPEQVN